MTLHKNTVFLFLAAAIFLISGCGRDSAFYSEADPEDSHKYNPGQGWRGPYAPESSRYATRIYEYTPAPGQFINDSRSGGMPKEGLLTPEEACRWAEERLEQRLFVSLGAFGGYIVAGFDHEVVNSRCDYDFAIFGNAFLDATGAGGSNEPGIVYVMEDTNGNGIPDDIWYELKGSEYYDSATLHDYAVTYYRPEQAGNGVDWSDNLGNSGTIAYLKAFHNQDFYYPAWISEDTYTLKGTRLAPKMTVDAETGFWSNNPFGWGYADNMGSDNTSLDGMPQANRFRISDAVDSAGNPVTLGSITFVKVQTGALSQSGPLGELSTEILGLYDLLTDPDDNAVPMIRL